MIAAMLSGCTGKKKGSDLAGMLDKGEEETTIEFEEPQIDKPEETDKKIEEENDKDEDKDVKPASAPRYCIGDSVEFNCETIHIIDDDGSYAGLSGQLEALNDEFLKAAKATGTKDTVRNICVRRADDKVFSFVHEYREPMGEMDLVQMRGYSFYADSGEKIALSDIVTDEDRFYEILSEELHKNVMENMMIIAGEYNLSVDAFDAGSAIRQCMSDNRYGWVLDPQGVTFWFENVNDLIHKASATVLFTTDKEGRIFNDAFAKDTPDEWIMRIPMSYSSDTYFDCEDDGILDSIGWYSNSIMLDGDFVDSGFGVEFNSRYFEASEICPADGMPWTNYSAYLMHKDKKTVLVAHYYEEVDSVWSSFTLTDDFVKSVDSVLAYPKYENYTDTEIGWLEPRNMSAIMVYTAQGGDEETGYPDEILTVETDGSMKISAM